MGRPTSVRTFNKVQVTYMTGDFATKIKNKNSSTNTKRRPLSRQPDKEMISDTASIKKEMFKRFLTVLCGYITTVRYNPAPT